MSREIDEIKYEVAMATRIISHMGLATGVTAALGHVSMRVPNQPDLFVVKGRGYEIDALEEMQYYDMIVCDLDGYKVDGPAKSTQCSEVKIHSSIMKRPPGRPLCRPRPPAQRRPHDRPRRADQADGAGRCADSALPAPPALPPHQDRVERRGGHGARPGPRRPQVRPHGRATARP